MKKMLIIATMLIGMITFAQENSTSYYLATGISIPNSNDFLNDSYGSMEVGLMHNNLAFGAVIGRNNLNHIGQDESLRNYWYEGKVAVYVPVGYVEAYGLLGVGSYIDNGGVFLEYGCGVSKNYDNFGLFVQVSNWDGTTYITPGLMLPIGQ